MKYLAITCSILLMFACQANQDPPTRKLTIIGTMHFPTEGVNVDSIHRALQLAAPEVILLERDSSAFDQDFNRIIESEENEFQATSRYLKDNSTTLLRPIEFEGRDQYRLDHGLYPQAAGVYQKLSQMYASGAMNTEHQAIWDEFATYWTEMEGLVNQGLQALNTSETDAMMEKAKDIQYNRTLEVVNQLDSFEAQIADSRGDSISMREYFRKWAQFEHYDRNDQMVENIIETMHSLPNERFAVLVGFHHRYYLKKKLEEMAPDIEIVEYYH